MNKQELRAAMARYGDRQEDLAGALGMSPPTLSDKINGKVDFWRAEIEIIALRYKLTAEDIIRIFFTNVFALQTNG